MKRYYLFIAFVLISANGFAQSVSEKLARAISVVEKDASLRHGILSICVEDAAGRLIYKHNAELGMAVASSQKVLTSVASFEILRNDFRFETRLLTSGRVTAGVLNGDLIIQGSGDPSLGSWRWPETKPSQILGLMANAVKAAGITEILGSVRVDSTGFSAQSIPDGWIWQDIGNYYGAGTGKLNWKENQYDLQLRSGTAVDSEVRILNGKDSISNKDVFHNELRAAGRGSGDNAIIYLPVGEEQQLISGTIPAGESRFVVSGAMPNPEKVFLFDLEKELAAKGVTVIKQLTNTGAATPPQDIFSYSSPSFDSLNFWFLRRSINLYGEAFVKAIAKAKTGFAATSPGVEEVRNFWATRGIEKSALRIMDGSGLSPQNRVTTQALVTTMRYAINKPWFSSFYEALPTINALKMKSGSIGGARSFTGYTKKQNNVNYVFAIVVNNYDGSSAAVVQKLYSILDNLK
jgi:D-alanyl-D-alanine carboxypeptidase/D-alanyl-D-alanine-endopeptidase (penicillin-binding protein 4)